MFLCHFSCTSWHCVASVRLHLEFPTKSETLWWVQNLSSPSRYTCLRKALMNSGINERRQFQTAKAPKIDWNIIEKKKDPCARCDYLTIEDHGARITIAPSVGSCTSLVRQLSFVFGSWALGPTLTQSHRSYLSPRGTKSRTEQTWRPRGGPFNFPETKGRNAFSPALFSPAITYSMFHELRKNFHSFHWIQKMQWKKVKLAMLFRWRKWRLNAKNSPRKRRTAHIC